MANKKKQSNRNDGLYWIIALVLIFTGFALPFGIFMIALKLLSGDKKPTRAQQEQQAHVGARTASSAQSASRRRDHSAQESALKALTKKGKRLTTVGGILTALFGLCTVITAVDYLWVLPDIVWYLEEIIPLLCFTGGGLACLWAGLRKKKKAKRCRNYLAMIGRRQSISISALASATGLSPSRVRDDLSDMLDAGILPPGFLDYGTDRLVLSDAGLTEQPKAEPEPKAPSAQKEENAILAEIRAVNDAIDNEKLSAQIDRIGVITAKILEYQKSRPEKAPQLHSFLSYYLPTTLKILRAYSQLEDQEVAGENITAAMQRIEGMMDKVVEGFEKQLDLLFQGDAMDITTDVEVLERMLAKDGLSGQQGLTLGL